MRRFLRKGVLFTLLLAGLCAPAAADPLAMFIIGIARQIIERHAESRGLPVRPAELPMPDMKLVYPGTTVEPEHLRRLIDDSFFYLTRDQRGEVFASLHAGLINPRNAAVRGAMIEHFATRALTIRAALKQLSELSSREKERLAAEFGRDLGSLTPEEQQAVGELLRKGLLPVPNDLNQLLLTAFERR